MNVVFDIETIPLPLMNINHQQQEMIDRRLATALKADPNLDQKSEIGKIMGTSAFLGRIACIGLFYPDTGEELGLADPNEKVILNKFWLAISDRKLGQKPVFISYNGLRFDIPFIIRRSMVHGIIPTNYTFMQYQKYDPRPGHYDVAVQLAGKDQMISLDLATSLFGIKSPKEGTVKAAGVAQAYAEGRIDEIVTYCLADLQATYSLFQIVSQYYK